MLTVMTLCRYIILAAVVIIGVIVSYFWGNGVLTFVLTAGIIWINIYLSGLKIQFSRNCIIKTTGNIFKHKTVILLKSVLYIETVAAAPWRPAFVRLRSRGRDVLIIGLNGRQAELLTKVAAIE